MTKSVSIAEMELPDGEAVYLLDSQVPASAVMISMIGALRGRGTLAIFGDARESVAAKTSLEGDPSFEGLLTDGWIVAGTLSSVVIHLLFMLTRHIALPEDVEIIGPEDQALVLETIGASQTDRPRAIVDFINRWKSARLDPEVVRAAAERVKNDVAIELAQWFEKYQAEMSVLDLLDYQDVIALVSDAITTLPVVGAEVARLYPHILVDVNGISSPTEARLLKGLIASGSTMLAFTSIGDSRHSEVTRDLLPSAPLYRATVA